jgi:Zn-dependent protease
MPFGPEILGHLAIYMVVLIFAISAHECGHAWMSYKFGDDTAYLLGRVTLDPRSHVDPIGTLLIPAVGFIVASTGAFLPLIGWGKPTPVNPLRWRHKDLANVMVSLAGIMANLAIAIVALLIIKVLQFSGAVDSEMFGLKDPLWLLLRYALSMNVSLAVFNLLPFPPLDGSHVLETVLPASARPMFELLEQYGFVLLMLFMWLGIFNIIFRPVQYLLLYLVYWGT